MSNSYHTRDPRVACQSVCARPSPDGSACQPCRELVESHGAVILRGELGFEILAPNERTADRMSSWADVVRVGGAR